MASGDPPCQDQACTLQTCLNRNTYAPEKCSSQMRKLYECCSRMYEGKEGGEKESTACPNEAVVKRWLKNHADEGK